MSNLVKQVKHQLDNCDPGLIDSSLNNSFKITFLLLKDKQYSCFCSLNTTRAAAQVYCCLYANYERAKPVNPINRFIPTCQIKHAPDRYVRRCLITQAVPLAETVAIVPSHGYSISFQL